MKKQNDELTKKVTENETYLFVLKESLDGKCQVIDALKGMLENYAEEAERLKTKAVSEVVNKLQVVETQVCIYTVIFSYFVILYSVPYTKLTLNVKGTTDGGCNMH